MIPIKQYSICQRHQVCLSHKITKASALLIIFQLFIFFFQPLYTYGQQRKDESLPKIVSTPKSLSSLTGWTKNNIGKWTSLPNGLPQYEYRYKAVLPYCENLLKVETTQISIEDKVYFCVAKFKKYVYGERMEKVTYHAYYWLFDVPSMVQDSKDTTVITRTYSTFSKSDNIIAIKPVTWTDIIKDIKRTLVEGSTDLEDALGLKASFCLQYRYDHKNQKVQFMLGTYKEREKKDQPDYSFGGETYSEPVEENELDFNLDRCSMNEKNKELSHMYYEIPVKAFLELFSRIL